MNINYNDRHIVEAECVDGKETITVACDCGHMWLFEDYEYELQPWPHVTCPTCGAWIPLF